jgi:hypothetical protein
MLCIVIHDNILFYATDRRGRGHSRCNGYTHMRIINIIIWARGVFEERTLHIRIKYTVQPQRLYYGTRPMPITKWKIYRILRNRFTTYDTHEQL